jgi:hypothetical protein
MAESRLFATEPTPNVVTIQWKLAATPAFSFFSTDFRNIGIQISGHQTLQSFGEKELATSYIAFKTHVVQFDPDIIPEERRLLRTSKHQHKNSRAGEGRLTF